MAGAPLRVLFATPECAPFVKTGGLGDVSGALPRALRRRGLDARLMLPAYPALASAAREAAEGIELPPLGALPAARLVPARLAEDLPAWLLECAALYDRPGGPYQDASGNDWDDNALRFAQLARAAARLGSDARLPWRAQAVHCNDWQTALAAAYLAFAQAPRAATLLTVHNLGFQGIFPAGCFDGLGLPAASFSPAGLEYHGNVSFLKAGLVYADAVATVSPTYAREIQSAPLGFGLEGVLQARRNPVEGILNGIDLAEWDPATDPWIARRYDAETLDAKAENKAALQARAGLALDPGVPLIGVVSRFTSQKGVDLVLEAAGAILAMPAQLVVLGTGEALLEREFARLAAAHARQASVTIGFDEPLAHLIEAGADLFLMPSRFEPCGMNQMYSQRYGTLPVVRATGGLADTVVDCTPQALADGTATGFVFREAKAGALSAGVARALAAWRDPPLWRRLQRKAMARDFGWEASARRYAALYDRIINPVSGA
jgi:starch synthase